jgi:hypothetical protein
MKWFVIGLAVLAVVFLLAVVFASPRVDIGTALSCELVDDVVVCHE